MPKRIRFRCFFIVRAVGVLAYVAEQILGRRNAPPVVIGIDGAIPFWVCDGQQVTNVGITVVEGIPKRVTYCEFLPLRVIGVVDAMAERVSST